MLSYTNAMYFFMSVLLLFQVNCDPVNIRASTTENSRNISVLKLPYIVSLKYESFWNENQYNFFCGGTILAERWILTAAHCCANRWHLALSRFAVDVGSEYLSNGTRYRIENYYTHPNYSTETNGSHILLIKNDVGLIRLTKPIRLTPSLQPVRLGTIEDQKEVPVLSGGWGKYSDEGEVREHVRIIELKTMKLQECRKIHARRNNLVDEKTHICGYGGLGNTLCFGDSGGPLVDLQTGHQVGVFSGLEDCSGEFPVLFMRIEPYIEWINNVTKLNITLL